jgi:glyoxylase-like metal-dependent hydrolase (beta-lactamase superfamily II)
MIKYEILSVGNSRYSPAGEFIPENTGSPTITLITSGGLSLLVDPGYGYYYDVHLSEEQELDKLRKKISECLCTSVVDKIYLTHQHSDHKNLADRFAVNPITGPGEIIPGVIAFETPGHCENHYSLEFLSDGNKIVVAGDAVPNKYFFRAEKQEERIYRINYKNYPRNEFAKILELSVKSMRDIAKRADFIIPGHGDKFKVKKCDSWR